MQDLHPRKGYPIVAGCRPPDNRGSTQSSRASDLKKNGWSCQFAQEITVIDLYCERRGPGLLAEPINALSNVSFLIAAWAAWQLAERSNRLSPEIWVLLALAVAVGFGSLVFHTYATTWALALDVAPILLFQVWFLWLYTRGVIGMRPELAAGLIAAFLLVAVASRGFPATLNGSLMYAPALLSLLVLGLYHSKQGVSEPFSLLAAAACFVVALVFRSVDEAVCPSFPIGTHFLWHSLNGLVVYLVMRCLIGG
jgi:hypothetical protein